MGSVPSLDRVYGVSLRPDGMSLPLGKPLRELETLYPEQVKWLTGLSHLRISHEFGMTISIVQLVSSFCRARGFELGEADWGSFNTHWTMRKESDELIGRTQDPFDGISSTIYCSEYHLSRSLTISSSLRASWSCFRCRSSLGLV